MDEAIIIELNPLDAEQFILFQKHYKKINHLIDYGAFELKDGSIEIHCNSSGDWKNIRIIKNNYPL
ncbi:MAG: hypothetical protein AABY22_04810 [Nanoarchaeota archaeon]